MLVSQYLMMSHVATINMIVLFLCTRKNCTLYKQLPFWAAMIIIAFDCCCRLLETNVIKSCKRSSINIFNGMVRYQEVFLPPHKNVISQFQPFIIETVGIKSLCILIERWEFTLEKNKQPILKQVLSNKPKTTMLILK